MHAITKQKLKKNNAVIVINSNTGSRLH